MTGPAAARIEGTVDAAFEPVRRALRENFAARGEIGASLAVIAGGRTVVDLWGGAADPAAQRAVDARHAVPRVLGHQGRHGAVRPRPGVRAAASTSTRRWRATGRSSPRRARRRFRSACCSITRPAWRRWTGACPAEALFDWDGDGRRARRAETELDAGSGARLSRAHLRLAGRRAGAARLRPVPWPLLSRRDRGAARPRLLDRAAARISSRASAACAWRRRAKSRAR